MKGLNNDVLYVEWHTQEKHIKWKAVVVYFAKMLGSSENKLIKCLKKCVIRRFTKKLLKGEYETKNKRWKTITGENNCVGSINPKLRW